MESDKGSDSSDCASAELSGESDGSENKVQSVYQDIDHSREGEGDQYVRNGVLLDEHGRKNDQNALHKQKALYDHRPFHKSRVGMEHRDHDGDGVIYVDAGGKIGRCIVAVNDLYQISENVLPGHDLWSEEVYIGENNGDEQENAHSDSQIGGRFVIVFLIRDQKIHGIQRNIKEPGKVGQNKNFTEGNHVICSHMDHSKVKTVPAFDQEEDGQVGGHENQHGESGAELAADHILPYRSMC